MFPEHVLLPNRLWEKIGPNSFIRKVFSKAMCHARVCIIATILEANRAETTAALVTIK